MNRRTLLQEAMQQDFAAMPSHGFTDDARDPYHGNAPDRPAILAQDDELRLAAQGVLDLMKSSPYYAASLHAPAVQRLKRALGVRS